MISFFITALQLLFIAFKLMGVIDWTWWLVVSPILALLFTFFIGLPIYAIAVFIIMSIKRRGKKLHERFKQ